MLAGIVRPWADRNIIILLMIRGVFIIGCVYWSIYYRFVLIDKRILIKNSKRFIQHSLCSHFLSRLCCYTLATKMLMHGFYIIQHKCNKNWVVITFRTKQNIFVSYFFYCYSEKKFMCNPCVVVCFSITLIKLVRCKHPTKSFTVMHSCLQTWK
jgi:hypothetical protein